MIQMADITRQDKTTLFYQGSREILKDRQVFTTVNGLP